jgi:hypothetical protein
MDMVICSLLGLVLLVAMVIFELKLAFRWANHRPGHLTEYRVRYIQHGVAVILASLITVAAVLVGGISGLLIVVGCMIAGALIGKLIEHVSRRYRHDVYGDDEKNDRH